MKTTKFLIFAALGVAAVLLFTTEKGEELRENMADNADKWKDQLGKLASDAGGKVNDLKKVFNQQIEGLTKDARKRIVKILEESTKSAKHLTDHVSDEIANN